MKYIVELNEKMTHVVFFKRRWFSRRKYIGSVTDGGIVAVSSLVKAHQTANFIRYDFINLNKPELSKKNQKFI